MTEQDSPAPPNEPDLERDRLQAAHLQTVSAVIRETTSLMEIDALLPRVARLIGEAFGYYGVIVFLKEEDSDDLAVATAYCRSEAEVRRGLRLKPDQGINGWVAASGQPLTVPDVSREGRYYFYEGMPGTRSEMAVPIRKGDAILGSLDFQSDRLDAFGSMDMLTASILADQLAAERQKLAAAPPLAFDPG